MTRILAITSSPNADNSVTTNLVDRLVRRFVEQPISVEVDKRDVGLNPPPHLDQSLIKAYYTAPKDLSEAQRVELKLSNEIVSELETADIVVIGAPMHNFTISSGLKTWIDHAARVGRTFAYTENGPKGLLTDKKVYVVTGRGGYYGDGSPAQAMDFQVPYLKTVLGFIGLDDVTFIDAHSVAKGTDGVAEAERQIDGLFAEGQAA